MTTTIPTKAVATDTISLSDYNAIAADINELIGRAGRNLLVNGSFEQWQLGNGPFTSDLAYTADMWQLDLGGSSSASVVKETTTLDNSPTALSVAYTHNGASVIQQKLEGYAQLRGKTLALSVRVRCSAAITVSVTIRDSAGASPGSVALAANTWTTITVVRAINAAATSITVELNLGATATYYFDNAMLVLGPNATEFVPLHPAEDLARCQRYIEIVYGEIAGRAAAGEVMGYHLPFKVTKFSASPTVTKAGTWTVINCAQPLYARHTQNGITMYTTVTATGFAQTYPSNVATDYFRVECYP